MKKCFFLIGVLTVGLISSCIGDEEPSPNHSSKQEVTPGSPAVPDWVKDLKWDEINDSDFTLSEDGTTLLKWNNTNIAHLDMNRNARLKKVKTIGTEAFNRKCDKLTAMVLSDEVQTLARECFDGPRNLEHIHLANVRTIGEEAFKNSKIKELHFPQTLEELDEEFYVGLENLNTLTVDERNTKFKTIDNVLFNKDLTRLITYPTNRAGTNYTIPKGVRSLGVVAFSAITSLRTITCPESLVEISIASFDRPIEAAYDPKYPIYYERIDLQANQVVQVNNEEDTSSLRSHIDSRTKIFVPRALVERYKTDKAWGVLSNQIYPID